MQPSLLLINNQHFAKQKESLQGTLDALQLERLKSALHIASAQKSSAQKSGELNASQLNKINYQLHGASSMQQYFLHLSLDAHLAMTCQRCLTEMPVHLNLIFNYLITPLDEAAILLSEQDVDDAIDLLPAEIAMDVALLIEDELLLALPIAPIHAHLCSELTMQSGEKLNPFLALKGLLKS